MTFHNDFVMTTATQTVSLVLLDCIARTTYIDAGYCYPPRSMVCQSVTLVSPAKMTEPIEMLFGLRTRVGPGNYVLHGSRSPMGRGNFEGERGVPLQSIGTLCSHLSKNGTTNRDAVWVVGSDGPKKSRVRWGPDPHGKGQFWGKGAPIVNSAVTCVKTAKSIIMPFGL